MGGGGRGAGKKRRGDERDKEKERNKGRGERGSKERIDREKSATQPCLLVALLISRQVRERAQVDAGLAKQPLVVRDVSVGSPLCASTGQ
jgi:hypothetical protein